MDASTRTGRMILRKPGVPTQGTPILLEKLVEYNIAHPLTLVALIEQYPNGKQTCAKDIICQILRFLLFFAGFLSERTVF